MRGELALILALMLGCRRPVVDNVALQSLEQAVDHPTARSFTFEADVLSDVIGVDRTTTWADDDDDPLSLGVTTERWFLPVVPKGATNVSVVYAWVVTEPPRPYPSPREPFLDEVREALRHGPVTWRAMTRRAGTPRARYASVHKGISDAELDHGIESHFDAPVFPFPQ